jgi:hypothetical protein
MGLKVVRLVLGVFTATFLVGLYLMVSKLPTGAVSGPRRMYMCRG